MAKLKDYFSWADINKLKSAYDINKLKSDPVGALFKVGLGYSAITGAMGVADQYLFGGAGEDFVRENIYNYGTGDWDRETNQYVGGEARKKGFLSRQFQTLRKYASKPFSAGAEFYRYLNTDNYTYEDYRDKVFSNSGKELVGPQRKGEGNQEYYMRQLLAINQKQKDMANRPPKQSGGPKHRDFAYGVTPKVQGMYTAGDTAAARLPGGYKDGGIGQGLISGYGNPARFANIASQYAGNVKTLGATLRLPTNKGIKIDKRRV